MTEKPQSLGKIILKCLGGVLLLVAFGLAGIYIEGLLSDHGSSDPKTSRLKIGQYAVIDDPKVSSVMALPTAQHIAKEFDTGKKTEFIELAIGTRVMVNSDDGSESDAKRRVRVIVLEGGHKDEIVEVWRENLRPG